MKKEKKPDEKTGLFNDKPKVAGKAFYNKNAVVKPKSSQGGYVLKCNR